MTAVISVYIKKKTKIGEFLCSHFNIVDRRICEFLCSHFNIEDRRKKSSIFDILCSIMSKKAKTQLKHIKKDLCSLWRGFCDWSNMSKWFVKFDAGNVSQDDDAPWSGRPVIVSDQIKTLIENNQCYTMWEVANILKNS